MNSYERLMGRLAGQTVDRPPNLSILMGFAARYAGIPYHEFCLQAGKMVEANIRCHEDFGVDIVTVMSDPYGEAVDYGMAVEFPENENPHALRPLWTDTPNADILPMPKIQDTRRMKERLRAIRLYAERLKGICPIAGWVEGPVAEYCDLRDINAAMVDFAEEASYVEEILSKLTHQAIYYSEAQLAAGADIIGIGDAACSLLGPVLYKKYGFFYEKSLVEAIHAKGGLVKLHICGNIEPLLPQIAALEADIVDVDWMVDFHYAAEILHGHSAVCGNIDPVTILLQRTPEEVKEAVQACLLAGNETSIISGGCETPPTTPYKNLRAIDEALSAWSFK